jgi:AcrR family transcriptional regulator
MASQLRTEQPESASEGESGLTVELLEKNRPQQARAIKTYEAILDAASELLVEVGLERISTNLIAERAGITVPALYRYFPNKYSVLNALGVRLVDKQNLAILRWYETYIEGKPPADVFEHFYELLLSQYEAIKSVTGGLQILHVLRSIGPLKTVRLESRWHAAEQVTRLYCENAGVEFSEDNLQRTRMVIEMVYCGIEMALDDERIEAEPMLRETAKMLRTYLETITLQAGIEL